MCNFWGAHVGFLCFLVFVIFSKEWGEWGSKINNFFVKNLKFFEINFIIYFNLKLELEYE